MLPHYRMIRWIVVFCLTMALVPTGRGQQVLERFKDGVAEVEVRFPANIRNENGTGFVISADSDRLFVLTARHVLYNGKFTYKNISVTLYLDRRHSYEATVAGESGNLDLAVLNISNIPADVIQRLPTFSLRTDMPLSIGETLSVFGGKSQAWQVPPVTITGSNDGDRHDRFRFTGNGIRDGFSGAALFDSSGRLAAVHLGQVDNDFGHAQRLASALTNLKEDLRVPMNKPEFVTKVPPPAGLIVIPTDDPSNPLSKRIYMVVNRDDEHAIVAYDQKNTSGKLLPLAIFRPSESESGRIDRIAVTASSERIFATDSKSGKLWVFDASRSGVEEGHIELGKTVGPISLSGDGSKLYVGVTGPIPEGRIEVFDRLDESDFSRIRRLPGSIRGVSCPIGLYGTTASPLMFEASQCGGGQDPLYVIDTRTDQVVRRLPGFAVGSSVVATPDASSVFVSTVDRLLAVTGDYARGNPRINPLLEEVQISAMAMSTDGRILFLGILKSGQGSILSIGVNTGKPCTPQPTLLEAAPSALAIGHNGSLYALLPNRLFVSDAKALECQ